jgi:hypothetical protein
VLAACSTIGWGDAPRGRIPSRLPVDVAAWAAADTCRDRFTGADPVPWHAGAPLLRHADGSYEIAIGRADGESHRVAMNGRIMRPEPIGVRTSDPSRARFLPAESTVLSGTADWLDIRVTPDDDGSIVHIDGGGAADVRPIDDHLRALLAMLETAAAARSLVAQADWPACRQLVEAHLTHGGPSCCARHHGWLADLLGSLALARTELGDLGGARIALSSAVGCAPDRHDLRAELARLDHRLARPADAERTWLRLVHSPMLGAVGRAFAEPLAGRSGEPAGRLDATVAAERSSRLLEAGDHVGAHAWAWRARAGHRADASLDASLARSHGDFRTAFAIGAAALDRHGPDPRLLVALSGDAIAIGDPAIGLHLIARHWPAFTAADDRLAHRTLGELLSHMDSELAYRILVAERCDGLLPASGHARAPLADRAGRTLLARVPDLRRRTGNDARHRSTPGIAVPGFEDAPGVAPVR